MLPLSVFIFLSLSKRCTLHNKCLSHLVLQLNTHCVCCGIFPLSSAELFSLNYGELTTLQRKFYLPVCWSYIMRHGTTFKWWWTPLYLLSRTKSLTFTAVFLIEYSHCILSIFIEQNPGSSHPLHSWHSSFDVLSQGFPLVTPTLPYKKGSVSCDSYK